MLCSSSKILAQAQQPLECHRSLTREPRRKIITKECATSHTSRHKILRKKRELDGGRPTMASLLPLDDASGGFLRVHSRAASTAYHVVVKKSQGYQGQLASCCLLHYVTDRNELAKNKENESIHIYKLCAFLFRYSFCQI